MKMINFEIHVALCFLVVSLTALCLAFAQSWADWLVLPVGAASLGAASLVWERKS